MSPTLGMVGLICRSGGVALLPLLAAGSLQAQAPQPAPHAQVQAPFDLTGYWVSVITQDWRYRMVVPGPGEYSGIPINLKAKQLADAWSGSKAHGNPDPCEAYGAAAIMLQPGRLHISWQDPDTLQVQIDAGMQIRLLRFASVPGAVPPSRQGYSSARWLLRQQRPAAQGRLFAAEPRQATPPPVYGQLEVLTDRMLPGLLRKNGVPYSAGAKMTEYWEEHSEQPRGPRWLIITTELVDAEFLTVPYVYNTTFQQEPNASTWDPEPCSLSW